MTENDTSTNGDEQTGRGKFGDGRTAPLYEFQASRFKGGRLFTPNVIRIWPDRVEEYEFHALRHKQTRAISYQQVSEVKLARGLVWSNIAIEFHRGEICGDGGHTEGRRRASEGAPRQRCAHCEGWRVRRRAPISAPAADDRRCRPASEARRASRSARPD